MVNNNCILCNSAENFRVIWENKDILIVFDNYQLNYNHILIIPKIHILSSVIYSSLLFPVIEKLIKFYRYDGFVPIIYEHGNRNENQTPNLSIDHAHIHFVGLPKNLMNINELLPSFDKKYDLIKDFFSNPVTPPYHMLSIGGAITYVSTQELPSQIFRKNVAKILGEKYWDWKIHGEIIKNQITSKNELISKFAYKLAAYMSLE